MKDMETGIEVAAELLLKHEQATRDHVRKVQMLLVAFAHELIQRALRHDDSKYSDNEAVYFAQVLPRLAGSTYGSEEYKACLREIQPAITHHNEANSHHPEHYQNGICGMDLLDIVEMLCDWKAATLRHNDGDIDKSIEINRKRFSMPDELATIFSNTVTFLDAKC